MAIKQPGMPRRPRLEHIASPQPEQTEADAICPRRIEALPADSPAQFTRSTGLAHHRDAECW